METTVYARTQSVALTQLNIANRPNSPAAQSPIQFGGMLGDQLPECADLAFAAGCRVSLLERAPLVQREAVEKLMPSRDRRDDGGHR